MKVTALENRVNTAAHVSKASVCLLVHVVYTAVYLWLRSERLHAAC